MTAANPDVSAPAPDAPAKPLNSAPEIWGMEPAAYCLLMHLSQLLGVVIAPLTAIALVAIWQVKQEWLLQLMLSPSYALGWAAPILLWVVNKDKCPTIDHNGALILNWRLSEFIYNAVSTFLLVIVIGIPLLIALLAIGLIFPIIGAVKAKNGKLWRYPFSISFLKSGDAS